MKEKELRESAKCIICGQPFGHTRLPLFWRITIERFGVDMQAVQHQQGLAMMLGGNGLLASTMGPDEEMAKRIGDPIKATICEDCIMKKVCIAGIAEQVQRK